MLQWRRTAALVALPLLFRLLGGYGITHKGVHRPILDKVIRLHHASRYCFSALIIRVLFYYQHREHDNEQVITKAFQSMDVKLVGAAFKCWHVLIDALSSCKLLVQRGNMQSTVMNPILVMLRKGTLPIKKVRNFTYKIAEFDLHSEIWRMLLVALIMRCLVAQVALCAWEHLLLVTFPDAPGATWHASDQDKELAEAFIAPTLQMMSTLESRDQFTMLANEPEIMEEVRCVKHAVFTYSIMIGVLTDDCLRPLREV